MPFDLTEQLTDEEILAADSFIDDRGDTIYSVTEIVTEESIEKTQTALYGGAGSLFEVEFKFEDSEGNLVSEIYDQDGNFVESITVGLGEQTDGVYDQVSVEFYVVSEDITLDAPDVVAEVMGSDSFWSGYTEGTAVFSGVTVDLNGDPSFDDAVKLFEESAIHLEDGTLVAWSLLDESGVQAYLNEDAATSSELQGVPIDATVYRTYREKLLIGMRTKMPRS